MILKRESPDDFIAVNSKFSARLPNVIIEPNNIASGITKGTMVADEYMRN